MYYTYSICILTCNSMGCIAAEDTTLSISSSQLPKNIYSYNSQQMEQQTVPHQSPVLLQPTKGLNYLLGTAPSSIEPAETDIRLINSPVQTVRDRVPFEEFIIHVENR